MAPPSTCSRHASASPQGKFQDRGTSHTHQGRAEVYPSAHYNHQNQGPQCMRHTCRASIWSPGASSLVRKTYILSRQIQHLCVSFHPHFTLTENITRHLFSAPKRQWDQPVSKALCVVSLCNLPTATSTVLYVPFTSLSVKKHSGH